MSYDRPVLSGINLSVGAGEILGVIGETGSGKTTLARAIVGLAPVTSGRVVFDGVERHRHCAADRCGTSGAAARCS